MRIDIAGFVRVDGTGRALADLGEAEGGEGIEETGIDRFPAPIDNSCSGRSGEPGPD